MPNRTQICINSRCVGGSISGVSRYASALIERLDGIECIFPDKWRHGVAGHFWEQFILPKKTKSRLFFTKYWHFGKKQVTITDLATIHCPQYMNPKFATLYSSLFPILVTRVKHVIAVSNFTRNCILENFNISKDKVTTIYNGVDSCFNPNAINDKYATVDFLKLPSSRYVLCLSSLEPRKNLSAVLSAWSRILHLLPIDLWLVIAGKPGSPNVFNSFDLGEVPARVFFTGYVDDSLLPSLIGGAIFFTYMSLYEGFGLPPLESMACGTPVLVSNQTALPEVVGDAGLYANPYDIDDVARQILLLANDQDLRTYFSIKGFERSALFSWDKCAAETAALLRKCQEL